MSKKRRNHSPEFKSKVALAVINGHTGHTFWAEDHAAQSTAQDLSVFAEKYEH